MKITITEIKAEIKDFKANQNSENTDYTTGYMSALSTLEGFFSKGGEMKNELKLYKLLMDADSPVSEFGWTSNSEFCVWINFYLFDTFMEKIREIVGDYLTDEYGTECLIIGNTVVIDILDALEACDIDVCTIFPKEEYEH